MASSSARTRLPRLAMVCEESPLVEKATSNVAVLPAPPNAQRSTYVVIASHSNAPKTDSVSLSSRKGPISMDELLASSNAGGHRKPTCVSQLSQPQLPGLQLCFYTIHADSKELAEPHVVGASAVAPDMMLIQTVDVRQTDINAALFTNTCGSGLHSSGSCPGNAASREADDAKGELAVEQVAWVGLGFVAVKTRQRAVLLVRTGLRGSSGSAHSDSASSDTEDYTSFMNDGAMENGGAASRGCNAVCAVFRHAHDFCSVTVPAALSPRAATTSPQQHHGEASLLLVAGLQYVDAVLCDANAFSMSEDKLSGRTSLTHHTWHIGPFTHIAATAVGSAVYVCGTSVSFSVEVFKWEYDAASSSSSATSDPVCVHQVLMTPGHFFYAIAVSASAAALANVTFASASQQASIDFWVVTGAPSSTSSTAAARTVGDGNAATPSDSLQLPSLRGRDGRYLQVAAPAPTTALQNADEAHGTKVHSTEYRTLNTVWKATREITDVPAPQNTLTTEASLAHLESVVSVRISAPRFLPTRRSHNSTAASSTAVSTLLQRSLLHIHGTLEKTNSRVLRTEGEAQEGLKGVRISKHPETSTQSQHCWESEVLTLDSPNSTAALEWLAEVEKEGSVSMVSAEAPPPWNLNVCAWRAEPNPGTVRNGCRHELLLHTQRRALKLSVSSSLLSVTECFSSTPAAGVVVEGTHSLPLSECLAGVCWCPMPSSASSPLSPSILLLSGTAESVDDAAAGESASCEKKKKKNMYGQNKRTSTWALLTDVQAALLCTMDPWRSVEEPRLSAANADVLAAVKSLVEAEGRRLQRHLDARMDRIELMLRQLTQGKAP